MGVFARLFRRSKNTEEASGAETRTDTPDTGDAAEVKAAEAAEVKAAEAVESADAGPRDTAEADEAADSESVGIPKQQSAGEAVDNDADKGART
ncbi:hypothetical protein [Streptomyces violaceorubidus]|uniref:Gliding motility protein n=1 Tax=Streptomyces violaceorubidus TaxID=284042 RepID=A0ABV1SX27_9ACTN